MAETAVVQIRYSDRSASIRQGLSAVAAAVGYGAWAYWVNASEEPASALRLASIHGSYAGLFTLASAGLMEWSFRRLGRLRGLRKHRWGLSFGLCNGLAFTVAASINTLSGNPMVELTILPGMLIGLVFTASYLHLLALSEAKTGL